MSCSTRIEYDFFDSILTYLEKEEEVKVDTTPLNNRDNCNSFSKMYTPKHIQAGEDICKLFIKLYTSLTDIKSKGHPNYEKDWRFLNYWLNINISKRKLNGTTCATNFTEGFSNHCMNTFILIDFSSDKIYNIREQDLNKMNLLYGLYENYRKLNNILTTKPQNKPDLLLEPSTKCCSYYVEANYLCNGKDNKFCRELKKFETKYKGLYDTVDGKGPEYTNSFKRLTQCDNNTMSTALIGTTVGLVPLLVGIYKFTPLGQLFNPNKRKFTQKYKSNDDKMRNIVLMDQECEHISSQQGTYNIKYHSV
ncbi:PIR protein [Plasmodium vivax]|nr:PIR protein [Plasmodium vivax]